MTQPSEPRAPGVPFATTLVSALVVLTALSITIMPCSHWELDEFLFRAGIESFEPLLHHPHPPGYPAFIGIGKAFTALAGDPFDGMRALSLIATLVGFAALAAAATQMTGSSSIGISTAVLFYFSCAQLVHSTTPMSDPPALMFLFVGLWAWTVDLERKGSGDWPAVLLGVAFSLSVGCRPQYSVAIVPALLVAIAWRRSWRFAVITVAAFGLTCITWMTELVIATGGFSGFLDYELGQAAYVAAHDAELSRGTLSTAQLWTRFVAHPWGISAISGWILLLAVIGAIAAVARRMATIIPLAILCCAHLLFTVASSDPADGVRYALAFQPLVALLVAIALGEVDRRSRRAWPSLAVSALFGAVSLVFVWPVVSARAKVESPPVRAAEWISAAVAPDALILHDVSLRPHAEELLADRETRAIEPGLREVWDDPDREVWIFADGRTATAGARLFEWDGRNHPVEPQDQLPDTNRPWMNAYGKLTRNHYGVVSVIPLPPERRYLPGPGVYPFERSPRRREWRWLAPTATMTIPAGRGDLRLRLHLPKEAPAPELTARVIADGAELATLQLQRAESVDVVVPWPDDVAELSIVSTTSYVPRELGGRDRRELALQLHALERVPRKDAPDETTDIIEE